MKLLTIFQIGTPFKLVMWRPAKMPHASHNKSTFSGPVRPLTDIDLTWAYIPVDGISGGRET